MWAPVCVRGAPRLLLLLLVLVLLVASGPLPGVIAQGVPGSYILEYYLPVEPDPDASTASERPRFAAAAASIASMSRSTASALLTSGVKVKELKAHRMYPGVSIRVAHGHDAALLKALKGLRTVKVVHPVYKYTVPRAVPGRKPALFGMDTSTGVGYAHAKLKLFGKGIKVGIIDTGVDYKHPALGKCFGKGCKVAFGYDFVGDDYDAQDIKPIYHPDKDPMDCNGHGTHVSGIVGANATTSPEGAFTGSAPQATIGMYRVFGCRGNSDSIRVLEALERAYTDGMDIVNLSLGSYGGSSYSPESVLAAKLISLGVMVFGAAGNEGSSWGLFEVNGGSGSLAPLGLSVASVDNLFFTSPGSKKIGPISDFSSWGPPPELDMKPTVTGIGGDVYSTQMGKDFGTKSGTSMATPFLAGCAALWLEASTTAAWQLNHLGKPLARTAARTSAFLTAVVGTAAPVPSGVSGFVEPVFRAGAGLVQIHSAIRNTVSIFEGYRPYILIPSKRTKYNVAVPLTNHGSTPVVFSVGSAKAKSLSVEDLWWASTPDAVNYRVTVAFPGTETIVVPPKKTATVQVIITIPPPIKGGYLYSGYLVFTPTATSPKLPDGLPPPSLSVPFLGYSGDYCTLPVLAQPAVSSVELGAQTFRDGARRLGACTVTFGTPECSVPNSDNGKVLPVSLSLAALKGGRSYPYFSIGLGRTTGRQGFVIYVLDREGKVLGTALDVAEVMRQTWLPWGPNNGLLNQVAPISVPLSENTVGTQYTWDGSYRSAPGAKKELLPPGTYTFSIAADAPVALADQAKLKVCPRQHAKIVGRLVLLK